MCSISHEMQTRHHPVTWWNMKVLAGLTLILLASDQVMLRWLDPLIEPPAWMAQLCVISGAVIFGYHYWLLRRNNRVITEPTQLQCTGGLFPWIRHPMYSADMIINAGLVLLLVHPLTLAVWSFACVALVQQARAEDTYLAQRFGSEHAQWREGSGLLLPRFPILRAQR